MNNNLIQKLAKVPAVDSKELLFYIWEHFPSTLLKIFTRGGQFHYGTLANICNLNNDISFLILQTTDEKGGPNHSLLHLNTGYIESFEIINIDNAAEIFSLGKMNTSLVYESSGKLEIQRAFKAFAESIFDVGKINIGAPTMELPADGQKLNRILKLTKQIQEVIISLLKDEDARLSWQDKYQNIEFINSGMQEVKAQNGLLTIFFPFEDIDLPEINKEELNKSLMSVL